MAERLSELDAGLVVVEADSTIENADWIKWRSDDGDLYLYPRLKRKLEREREKDDSDGR